MQFKAVFLVPSIGTHSGLCLSPADTNEMLASIFQCTEAIFQASGISKWDELVNQPAGFLVVITVDYSLHSCYWKWGHRPTGQHMTHKYSMTSTSALLVKITPRLHLGHFVKFTVIVASQ